jgi:hypothetical protein
MNAKDTRTVAQKKALLEIVRTISTLYPRIIVSATATGRTSTRTARASA